MKKNLLSSFFAFSAIAASAQTGNVGINTDSPKTVLDVNGNARVQQLPAAAGTITYGGASATYSPVNTVVADANGVLGIVVGTPATSSTSNFWSLTGNAGTTAGNNFLGTTDAQPLIFKVNNTTKGLVDNSKENIAFGSGTMDNALSTTLPAYRNVAIGYQALKNVTYSSNNVAIGSYALTNQLSGDNATRQQWGSNVAIGLRAMEMSTIGLWNVAIGEYALHNLTTGWQNVALGNRALMSVTTGWRNTALGSETLSNITTDGENHAIGWYAFRALTSGQGNIAMGSEAAQNLTTGSHNVLLGHVVMQQSTSGSNNFIVGNNVQTYTTTTSNEMNLGNLLYGTGFLNPAGTQRIGIATGATAPNSTLQVGGSMSLPIRAFSGAVTDTDYTVLGTGDVTLPDPTGYKGRIYEFVFDGTPYSVNGNLRWKGANYSSYGLNSDNNVKGFTVQSDGTRWIVTNALYGF